MPLITDIDLIPDDVEPGDLGHTDIHDLLTSGVKAMKSILLTLESQAVRNNAVNQTVAGTKTFSSPINGATPTADAHLTTKLYVDQGLAGKTNTGHVHSIANITSLQSTLDGKAPLASPALTGTPTAPTQSAGDNTTKIATTAFVLNAVATAGVSLTGNQTIDGVKTFTSSPRLTATSTAGYSWVASGTDGSGSWVALTSLAAGGTVPWANITGRPSTFTPEAHTHTLSQISDLSSRSTIAGTGLTGGGDWTASRTLAVVYGTSGGTAAQGNDSRLSDTRIPTDGSVTNTKYAATSITIDKLATTARPYDFAFVQSLDTRAVGYGEMVYGVRISKAIVITSIRYRMGTADASGTTTCQLYSSATAAAANVAIADTSGTAAVDATAVTGSFSIAAGTYLYVYTSAIGTTPGKGLIADIEAYLA